MYICIYVHTYIKDFTYKINHENSKKDDNLFVFISDEDIHRLQPNNIHDDETDDQGLGPPARLYVHDF